MFTLNTLTLLTIFIRQIMINIHIIDPTSVYTFICLLVSINITISNDLVSCFFFYPKEGSMFNYHGHKQKNPQNFLILF